MILTIVDENVGYSDGHYITVWWTGKMLWASGQVTDIQDVPAYLRGWVQGRMWALGCCWTGNYRCVLAFYMRLSTGRMVDTGLLLDR